MIFDIYILGGLVLAGLVFAAIDAGDGGDPVPPPPKPDLGPEYEPRQ